MVERHEQLAAIDIEPLAVIKPNRGLRGQGVNLIRTALLRQWTPQQLAQSPSNMQGMVVQQYIDIGANPTSDLVMTVLGEVIYFIKSIAHANVDTQDPPEDRLRARAGRRHSQGCPHPRTLRVGA